MGEKAEAMVVVAEALALAAADLAVADLAVVIAVVLAAAGPAVEAPAVGIQRKARTRTVVIGLMTGPISGTIQAVSSTKRRAVDLAGLMMGLPAAVAAVSFLVSGLFLVGCGRIGLSTEDIIAGLPGNFTETPGSARIMPADGGGVEGPSKGKKAEIFRFIRRSSAHNPYCGASLRLIPDKVEGKEEYQKFLLPRTIIQYTSPYPAAVSVDLGDAAEEIRCIAPKGDHYIGLIPNFKQEWLFKIGQGGVADQVARASAVWAWMGSEDLKAGVNFLVSSVYHFPREDFFPLFVSLVNPLDPSLPMVDSGAGGGVVERWVEGLVLKRVLPRSKSANFLPPEDGKEWILMKPFEQVLMARDPSKMEAAILIASMATRDGIPCWFAVFPETVFLFLGGAPGDADSFVFSVEKYLTRAEVREGYEFMDDSRRHYLGVTTSQGEPKFIDSGDFQFFHPLPVAKGGRGGGAPGPKKAEVNTKGRDEGNPFKSPK